jgi:PDZ domain/Aspartyl protease
MRYKLLLLMGLLALPALLVRADTPPKKAAPVTVPFELLKSGHMAVQVKVNGKGPYRLIFDTGAPVMLINNKIARESGIADKMEKTAMPVFGAIGEASIKSVEVGGAKAADVSAVVMDHPTVEEIAKHVGPIHGIVGFPFFARFKMTLDYEKKTLTFEPNGYKPPDVMKSMVAAILAPAGPLVLAPAGQWGVLVEKKDDDEAPGVEVKTVIDGSAARKAGLKPGDRLLTIDGRWTDSIRDLYDAAGRVKPGTTVTAKVKREGKEIAIEVTPGVGM